MVSIFGINEMGKHKYFEVIEKRRAFDEIVLVVLSFTHFYRA